MIAHANPASDAGGTFHTEDIQGQAELALMRGGHHGVARAYVLNRKERAKERASTRGPPHVGAVAGTAEGINHSVRSVTCGTLCRRGLGNTLAEAAEGGGAVSMRQWKPMLELKLRRSDGKAFQDFVADFLSRLYPDDFIRVRPHGPRGDGGMDGFRLSTGTLYQCYGAREGYVHAIDDVCRKLVDDFHTARTKTPEMRQWLFTHNLTDLPRPLVDAYLEVERAGAAAGIGVGLHGPQKFRDLLSGLDEDDLEDLIGIGVYSADDVERLPETVNIIIRRVIEELDGLPPRYDDKSRPPVEKFDFNLIPPRWRSNFISYYPHSQTVKDLVATASDVVTPIALPEFMRMRYTALRAEGFDAGGILKFMHEELAGYVNEYDGRYEAAMAVLACMFESCVIFEDKKAVAETGPTR